jgi:Astacin (Peptidase family M12A)
MCSKFSADVEKNIIKKGMEEIQNETCIAFKPRTTETAYMSYKNDKSGCFATAGYQGKKQEVNMAKDCFEDVNP